jgi:hypothetical protein
VPYIGDIVVVFNTVVLEEVDRVEILPVNASHVQVTWQLKPSAERPDVQLEFKVTATSQWHSVC